MISGFILLEVAATILLIYGFTQEEKIIEFEDQMFLLLKNAAKNIIIVEKERSRGNEIKMH